MIVQGPLAVVSIIPHHVHALGQSGQGLVHTTTAIATTKWPTWEIGFKARGGVPGAANQGAGGAKRSAISQ